MAGVVHGRRTLVVLTPRGPRDEAGVRLKGFSEPQIFCADDDTAAGVYGRLAVFDLDAADAEAGEEDLRRSARAELSGNPAATTEAVVAVATLDAQAERRVANDTVAAVDLLDFAVLSNAAEAIEEVFSRMYKYADMAAILRLPGALSARRYTLHPPVGPGAWEMLTLCQFEREKDFDPAEGIRDCLGESDPLVLQLAPGD
jgi:hypothetical protein